MQTPNVLPRAMLFVLNAVWCTVVCLVGVKAFAFRHSGKTFSLRHTYHTTAKNHRRASGLLALKVSSKQQKCSSLSITSSNDENSKGDEDAVVSSSRAILPSDPRYSTCGPIGDGNFTLTREGPPTEEELSNENLLKILMIECSDLEVNTLVWKGLGYRFDPENRVWSNDECFPKWREKYPSPPDLVGMQRIYTKEIDQPSLKANQALVRSVPVDSKQSLKTHLKPYGFKGYKYAELTPNKTRRAQCANWLVYYREELFGYSVDELREKRRKKLEEAEKKKMMEKGKEDEWSPPVTEVF